MQCQLALKEWNVVCEAVRRGEQIVLTRKGGISEPEGEFALPKDRFWLYPTWFHEASAKLNEHGLQILRERPELLQPESAKEVTLELICEVTDAIYLEDPSKLKATLSEQILSEEALLARFHYRASGIYLLFIQAYQVANPIVIVPSEAMSGCKSWVELPSPLESGELTPIGDGAELAARKKMLLSGLNQ